MRGWIVGVWPGVVSGYVHQKWVGGGCLEAREFGPGGRFGRAHWKGLGTHHGGLLVRLGKVPQSALRAGTALRVWQVSGKTPGLPAFRYFVLRGVSALDSFSFAEDFTILLTLIWHVFSSDGKHDRRLGVFPT